MLQQHRLERGIITLTRDQLLRHEKLMAMCDVPQPPAGQMARPPAPPGQQRQNQQLQQLWSFADDEEEEQLGLQQGRHGFALSNGGSSGSSEASRRQFSAPLTSGGGGLGGLMAPRRNYESELFDSISMDGGALQFGGIEQPPKGPQLLDEFSAAMDLLREKDQRAHAGALSQQYEHNPESYFYQPHQQQGLLGLPPSNQHGTETHADELASSKESSFLSGLFAQLSTDELSTDRVVDCPTPSDRPSSNGGISGVTSLATSSEKIPVAAEWDTSMPLGGGN